MKFILTKKDIISFNQRFDEGNFHNESSLDFALNYANKTENWIKALSFLVRAILIDHVFEEGNKRTVALLIKSYAEYERHEAYTDKVVNLIQEITTKNIIKQREIFCRVLDFIKKTAK